MTTKLYRTGESAVTVRDPETVIDKTSVRVATEQRMLDGTLKQRIIAPVKWRWDCTWKYLTDTEYNTLIAELQREVAMTFQPPDEATTYDVLIVGDVDVQLDDAKRHTVSATIEEV